MNRRKFVQNSGLTALSALLGAEIVFGNAMPKGYIPLGLQDPDPFKMFDKDPEMIVHNDKPWNIESLAHLLDELKRSPYRATPKPNGPDRAGMGISEQDK